MLSISNLRLRLDEFSKAGPAATVGPALPLNSWRLEAPMVFGLGMQELLVIFIIVLFIFGGKRLPEIGNAIGRSLREFKKATRKERDEVSTWIKPPLQGDESTQAAKSTNEHGDSTLKGQLENLPGMKEAQEIKETAGKIKAASRMFLKK